jgi:hypothetical protein
MSRTTKGHAMLERDGSKVKKDTGSDPLRKKRKKKVQQEIIGPLLKTYLPLS